jgi:hypothetical protein
MATYFITGTVKTFPIYHCSSSLCYSIINNGPEKLTVLVKFQVLLVSYQ